MARPKKKVTRYYVLSVRVTEEERAACIEAAGKGSVDSWLYYRIFGRIKL
jgi:hypothetical protein